MSAADESDETQFVPGITRENFMEDCEERPLQLYEKLHDYFQHYHKAEKYFQAEIEELREKIENKDDAIQELMQERDDFQGAFAREVLKAREVTPEKGFDKLESSSGHRSAKIPDPPILTDGKDPKFENWLSQTTDKLAASDHYPTAALRLAYVKSRCGGRAAEHLNVRSRPDNPNRYMDAADVF